MPGLQQLRRFLPVFVLMAGQWAWASAPGEQTEPAPTTQPNPASRPAEIGAATAVPANAESTGTPAIGLAALGRFGVIVGDAVRVRGAASDGAAEVMRLDKGDVVEVVGQEGSWVEVRVPGGFAVFVRSTSGTKPYIDDKVAGEAVVLVNDLLLRLQPKLDAFSIGKVHTGTKLTIVETLDGWHKVQAPADETLFVRDSFVTTSTDQESLERDFNLTAEQRLESVAKSADEKRAARLRQEDLRRWDERLAALDGRFSRAMRTPDDEKEWTAVRAEYETFLAACPAESPARAKAGERAELAKARVDEARTLRETAERITALEATLSEQNQRYVAELESFRARKENTLLPQKGRYLEFALGALRKDILTEFGDQPVFTLTRGGQRHFFLVSERYDLDDYLGRTIGIVEAAFVEPDTGGVRTMKVSRLDILD